MRNRSSTAKLQHWVPCRRARVQVGRRPTETAERTLGGKPSGGTRRVLLSEYSVMLCMTSQSVVGLLVRIVSFTRSDRVVLLDEIVRRYSKTRRTSKQRQIQLQTWVHFVRLWERKRTERFTERTPTVELRFHVLFFHWKQKTIALHCVWYTSDPRCCRQCQRNNNVVRR